MSSHMSQRSHGTSSAPTVSARMAGTSASTATAGPIYGISNVTGLVSVDPTTADMTPIGKAVPLEAQAQELSALDAQRGIMFLLGFNETSSKPNVVGIDTTTGAIRDDIVMPFQELPFVGLGQSIDVDPGTGDLIVSGEDPTGTHQQHFYRLTRASKYAKVTSVAAIGGG